MKPRNKLFCAVALLSLFVFGGFLWTESSAWARAGGGGSSGSRGSRSFSSPRTPSSPSPGSGFSSPGSGSFPSSPGQPSTGTFSRSPFLQGMAGGLAGGLLGNMLFGSRGYAAPGGGGGGGGIGFLDLLILGALAYFGWKFYKRRRAQMDAAGYGRESVLSQFGQRSQDLYSGPSSSTPRNEAPPAGQDEVQSGFDQIRQVDSRFSEEAFKETAQDVFFRIQAGWMNRSLEGIQNLLTPEMTAYFSEQFDAMRRDGRVNRLENIAIRKVEPTEVWQETGKDYVTVLFTANLLDYTVDDQTGKVVQGDRMNPVKFQEFWTFCRNVGSGVWQLAAINQVEDNSIRYN